MTAEVYYELDCDRIPGYIMQESFSKFTRKFTAHDRIKTPNYTFAKTRNAIISFCSSLNGHKSKQNRQGSKPAIFY